MSHNRMTAWSSTVSGNRFTPFNPCGKDIDIVDISTALANQARFNGHLKSFDRFYSVAEHSFYVSHIVSPRAAFYALMHDAPEAYIGDMIQPLKQHFPEFRALEQVIMDEIIERFHIPVDAAIIEEVRKADKWIAHQEGRAVHTIDEIMDLWGPPPLFKPRVHIDPAKFGMKPEDAFVAFNVRFGDLCLEEYL